MASKNARAKRRSKRRIVDRWKLFAGYSPRQLAGLDIALLNLACAEGLPGGETLDIPRCLATLNRWRDVIRGETRRNEHRFPADARKHGYTLAQWRIGMMVTVLQKDLGMRYNPSLANDWDFPFDDARDVFIHGMIPNGRDEPRGGSCTSMPVMYVAIGRRLGYPLKLVGAKGHLFFRWVDEKSGETFNVEGSSRGFHFYPDDYYHDWPIKMTPREIASGRYLRSLTRSEEMASALATRGHVLEDHGRWAEAIEMYEAAIKFDSKYRGIIASVEAKAAASSERINQVQPK